MKSTFFLIFILLLFIGNSYAEGVCDKKINNKPPMFLLYKEGISLLKEVLKYKSELKLTSEEITSISYEEKSTSRVAQKFEIFCPNIGVEKKYEKKFKFTRSENHSLTKETGVSITVFNFATLERKYQELSSHQFSTEDESTVSEKIIGDGVNCYQVSYVALYRTGKIKFKCTYEEDQKKEVGVSFEYLDGYDTRLKKCNKELYLTQNVCAD